MYKKRDRCLNEDYLFKEKAAVPTVVLTSVIDSCLWKDSPCLSAAKALGSLCHLIASAVHTGLTLFGLRYEGCQFRFILITTLMDEPRS